MTQDKPQAAQVHPVFWFSDGSIVLRAQEQLFRVHHSLLSRLSPFFATLGTAGNAPSNDAVYLGDQIWAPDLEILFQYLYHDVPLSFDTSIDRFASILRITSPRLLDFPAIHTVAKEAFAARYPRELALDYRPTNTLQALALANEYRLLQVRKALLYSIIISDDYSFHGTEGGMEPIKPDAESEIAIIRTQQNVFDADAERCSALMNKLIEHFTPVLFTPVTTPHLTCTDVFADTWSSLIAEPAIINDWLIRPLETLERMKNIDWQEHGLCASCTMTQRKEWTAEQHAIWNMMDGWLKDDSE
ncbi:hypothetical protein AX14_008503 [Amanita brunnescens Koide BX004]|nr:hypothetical protein AX14_008503 [Amanita brunnescens Koide BX004]